MTGRSSGWIAARGAIAGKTMARALPFLIIAVAVLILMWPRAANASFGLLDDGMTIKVCRAMTDSLDASVRMLSGTGRFLPVYYFYNSAIYSIGWASPLFFYLVNAFALLFVAVSIFWFMRYRGGTILQATSAALIFIFCGPVLETFYTLSKPEVPVAICLSLVLFCVPLFRETSRGSLIFFVVAVAVALLLANGSKEISVVMVAIAAGWHVTSRLAGNDGRDRLGRTQTGGILIGALISAAAIFAWRSAAGVSSVAGGSYTSAYTFGFRELAGTAAAWTGVVLRTFPHILVLAAGLIWTAKRFGPIPQWRLLVDSVIWMVFWIGVYLPWKSTLEYYLLPFSLGCAIFGGLAVGELWEHTTTHRRWAAAVLALSLGLFTVTLVNNRTNGAYQILMDTANTEMVERIAELPAASTVLVNMPFPSEYVFEIGVHLTELYGRSDIEVDYFRFDTAHTRVATNTYYVASPMVRNQLFPSVRYPVYEGNTIQWNEALRSFAGSSNANLIYQGEHRLQLIDIGLQNAARPLVGKRICCSAPRPLIDTRVLEYGWTLHKIENDPYRSAWPAQFRADGTWKLYGAGGVVHAVHLGGPGDLPVSGDWNGDGTTDIGVYRPSDLTWRLDVDLDGQPEYSFKIPGMQPGDSPLMADWDGDGRATPGFYRPTTARWTIQNDLEGKNGSLEFGFGVPGDIPLTGDWDGDGRDTVAIYRPATGEFHFQNSLLPGKISGFSLGTGARPIIADWGGHGIDTPAVITGDSKLRIYPVNSNRALSNQPLEIQVTSGGQVIGGRWSLPRRRQ